MKQIEGTEFFINSELTGREYIALCSIGDIPRDDPVKAIESLARVCAACIRDQEGNLINTSVEYWLDQSFSVIELCGNSVLNSVNDSKKKHTPQDN